MKLRLLAVMAGIVAVAAFAAAATADPSTTGNTICPGAPTPLTGSHPGNLTVTGNVYVPDDTTLSVGGNLTVAPGACLDGYTRGNIEVGGNLLVHKGAILGLGCSIQAEGPPAGLPNNPDPTTGTPCLWNGDQLELGFRTHDVVNGNLIADGPYTMYITSSAIKGNLVSNGGGDPSLPPWLSYPIKDTTVGGNLILQGWQGAWVGVLRSTIQGNMIVSNNVGTRLGDDNQPDSTEIVGNQVSGNLICMHNTPTARYGDAGAFPNTVGGRAIGECTAVTG